MGYTSTAAKRKYNDKTYSRFAVDLRKQDFEEIEKARGEMSRSQFLLMLFREHQERMKTEG